MDELTRAEAAVGRDMVQGFQAASALAQALVAVVPTAALTNVTTMADGRVVAMLLTPENARQLAAVLQLAQSPAGRCIVCNCLLANQDCGHTCCCPARKGRR